MLSISKSLGMLENLKTSVVIFEISHFERLNDLHREKFLGKSKAESAGHSYFEIDTLIRCLKKCTV